MNDLPTKHPHADAYAMNGGTVYTPYAYLATDKRFTDAELAAEYWHAVGYYLERHGVESSTSALMQAHTLHRFACLPHYDDGE